MDAEFIRRRMTELRISRGVSEYKMSLDLGHSRSYMQSIASGRSLPSMLEFLYICEYLGVTPSAFFDDQTSEPVLVQTALNGMRTMSERDLTTLITLIDRLKEK